MPSNERFYACISALSLMGFGLLVIAGIHANRGTTIPPEVWQLLAGLAGGLTALLTAFSGTGRPR